MASLELRCAQQIFRRNRKIKISGNNQQGCCFWSQWGEDTFLFKHFLNLERTDGTFLEAGACDGQSLSNTKFFEDTLGYCGILVEPIADMYEEICRTRPRCRAVRAALIDDGARTVRMRSSQETSYICDDGSQEVPACRLSDILDLPYLDFLSLDVEGSELKVLAGFPWQRVPLGLLLIETLNDINPCAQFLTEKTHLRFAAKCGRNSAGSSEVWVDPHYFRRHLLYKPSGSILDGWTLARLDPL